MVIGAALSFPTPPMCPATSHLWAEVFVKELCAFFQVLGPSSHSLSVALLTAGSLSVWWAPSQHAQNGYLVYWLSVFPPDQLSAMLLVLEWAPSHLGLQDDILGPRLLF